MNYDGAILTVWRVASQDSSWMIGLRPWFMRVDSAARPDLTQILYEGATLVVPDGDGANPIEFRWDFDQPIVLPARDTVASYLFRDPCFAYIDLSTWRGIKARYRPALAE